MKKALLFMLFLFAVAFTLNSCIIIESCKHDDPTQIVVCEAKDPTCQKDGITEGIKCNLCGVMVTPQAIIPKLDCIETDWIVDKEATKTEDGAKHTECTVCGRVMAEETLYAGSVGLAYTVNADEESCAVTGIGACTDSEVVIPTHIDGYKVASIHGTFRECTSITSVTIPNSVTSIGSGAFSDCTLLRNIIVDESNMTFKSIEGNLYSKDGLTLVKYAEGKTNTSFVIPASVAHIAVYAFGDSTSLTSVTIPDSVTSIDPYAFQNCFSLSQITIPSSVTCIEYGTFYGCASLASVSIPSSVTGIRDYAFKNCSSLSQITIPSSVTSIGDNAFEGCNSLIAVTIPDSITSIGTGAFKDCSSLKYYECDNAYYLGNENNPYVVLIEAKSKNITSFKLQNDTKIIYNNAFSNCTYLTSITIPSSLMSIGKHAFFKCSSLISAIIPASVASIGAHAFQKCSLLTNVSIPDSVTSIGDYTFEGCSSLSQITIPDSVMSIGDYAFGYCSSLSQITIPDSVMSIGDYAFNNCELLTSITIHHSTTDISFSAFEGCSALTSIIVDENNMAYKSIDGNLYSKDGTKLIKYASGKTDESFVVPTSVTHIFPSAFYGCTSLTSITIPDSVTSIGEKAFWCCRSLSRIIFDGTVGRWNTITKGEHWNANTPATEVICSNGTVRLK